MGKELPQPELFSKHTKWLPVLTSSPGTYKNTHLAIYSRAGVVKLLHTGHMALPNAFVNKILLENSLAHFAQFSTCDRDETARKVKTLTFWSFTEKSC
jgi:hypothetical protein